MKMEKKKFDIYIDGSHLNKQNKGEDRLGCGGVLISDGPGMGNLEGSFSTQLEPKYMKMCFGAENASNPSAELLAVYQALLHFRDNLKDADEIVVHADYMGVKQWMEGRWRVKEPYIVKIKNAVDNEIAKQRLKGKIKFAWVKGHQKGVLDKDAYWNSEADLRARGDKD